MVEFSCDTCLKVLRSPERMAGLQAVCPACGGQTTVPAFRPRATREAAEDSRRCPQCGEAAATDASRCPLCGERLDARAERRMKAPHRGSVILTLGVISLVGFFPAGIAAWFLGGSDVREMNAGRMEAEGQVATRTGRILGLIGVLLWAAVVTAVGVSLAVLHGRSLR